MSRWIIGDVHGCFDTLQVLLEKIEFDPQQDQLIQVGDLANKGPSSLQVLRWAFGLGDRFQMVLGNHDLHLLARTSGRRARKEDTLEQVLEAPDREELLSWLGSQPLIVIKDDTVVVHAGFMPSWSLNEAVGFARKCEDALREGRIKELYERRKQMWSFDLKGRDRIAASLAVMTRIRMVSGDQTPIYGHWGPRETAPEGSRCWFENSKIIEEGYRVVFGHWATLGLFRSSGVLCIDSGCVYGGSLSAVNLDDDRIVQVEKWNDTKRA